MDTKLNVDISIDRELFLAKALVLANEIIKEKESAEHNLRLKNLEEKIARGGKISDFDYTMNYDKYKDCLSTAEVAKKFGTTADVMHLKLRNAGDVYRVSDCHSDEPKWVYYLYPEYSNLGHNVEGFGILWEPDSIDYLKQVFEEVSDCE